MLAQTVQAYSHTVMVVDDDVDLRSIMACVLDSEGLGVIMANDGQHALDLLERGQVPDLILSDMTMPLMGGEELCAKLKENSKTKDVPFVLMSGQEDIEVQTQLMGASGCLRKPYQLEALTSLIKTYLKKIRRD
jgi:CheY-like chemotaxis protein